jgi:small-conductance mechanosensitive channel
MVESIEASSQSVWLIPTVVIVSAILLGLFFEYVVLRALSWIARRTSWVGDDVLLQALRGMFILWFALLGISLIIQVVPLPLALEPYKRYVSTGISIIFILSFTLLTIRIGTGLVRVYGGRGNISSVSILNNMLRGVLAALGLMLVLNYMGISVTPALAALGVSSLAVSLALQEPLSSLFSGVLMVASNQIRPGNYVRLSSGEEGYVADINWRTTNIRQLTNNLIIVPNSVMSSAIIVNHDEPDKEMAVLFNVGVSYDSDLELVERVTIEVANEVMQEVDGGVASFEPFIRYNDFADFRVNFTVILRGLEFVNQYLIKHEFVKRLHKRYRQEGIVIPCPIRTIQTPNAQHVALMNITPNNGQHAADAELSGIGRVARHMPGNDETASDSR